MMYSTLTVWLILALGAIRVNAQCTLGYTYAAVESNYRAKSNLVRWEEKKSDTATAVRYDEDGTDITYASFLVADRVVKYTLMGDAKIRANEWGEYANNHFAPQKYGIWIDYATRTRWTLTIKESGLAVFEAVIITD